MASLLYDLPFYKNGIQYLCGVDEAGRGPLAGPVVAAALIFKAGVQIAGLNDSKKLNPARREKLEIDIKASAHTYAIGTASVEEIERLNIRQATFLAMKRALSGLAIEPDYILVDGRDFPSFMGQNDEQPLRGRAVVKGDGKSHAIAGASVLAKVYRDREMDIYAQTYPQYRFDKHKGYGTKEHRQAILNHGSCPIHRALFLRKLIQQADHEIPLLRAGQYEK